MNKLWNSAIISIRLLLLFVCIVQMLSISGCCKPALIGSLPVQLHPQQTSNWCWAASGQMVMHFLGHNITQCTQANNRFGRTDCCTIDTCPPPTEAPQYNTVYPFPCNNCACPGWPEFDKYGFTFRRTSGTPLTWAQVRSQISDECYCSRKPFAFSWKWLGTGGHMMVVKGYVTVAGVNYVDILDPWAPCYGDERIITYDFYNADPADHTHWDDFYDITYVGGN